MKRRLITTNKNLNLSSPWVNFYREIVALFGDDHAIKIDYSETDCVIKLYVEGDEKADALTHLLPEERTFGNVTVKVRVIPANESLTPRIDLFRKAFEGNPAFAYAKTVKLTPMTLGASYVVFKNKVVQYFNDDLSDVNGLCSTLYEDIASDVFGTKAGLYFCTDIEEPVYSPKTGKPLGEWP